VQKELNRRPPVFNEVDKFMMERYVSFFSAFFRESAKKSQRYGSQLLELRSDVVKTGQLFGEPKDFKSINLLTSIFNFATGFRNTLK
jgi:hypothetical protein